MTSLSKNGVEGGEAYYLHPPIIYTLEVYLRQRVY